MGVFKYVLPSGAEYTVQAPAGATQAQVDFVFYSQVAAGSLVGYTNGQQLLSEETRLAKFGLSRLDRGTAGVDTLAILAIIEGAPAIAPAPALTNIPLKNPIGPAAYALAATPLGQTPVGPLTTEETQALIAQIKEIVDQHGLSWEVNIWHYLELHHSLSIQWYKADHNDSIIRIPQFFFKCVASLTTIPSRI
jgi:hypothetical protein